MTEKVCFVDRIQVCKRGVIMTFFKNLVDSKEAECPVFSQEDLSSMGVEVSEEINIGHDIEAVESPVAPSGTSSNGKRALTSTQATTTVSLLQRSSFMTTGSSCKKNEKEEGT